MPGPHRSFARTRPTGQALALLTLCCLAWPTAADLVMIPLEPDQQQGPSGGGLVINPQQPDPRAALELGLVVFDPGLSGDSGQLQQGISRDVREAEARYLPYALRRTLVDSNQWGAVRVLPNANPGTELLVNGRILHSDGDRLSFRLSARDSRGQLWLEQDFSAVAEETAYLAPNRRMRRPFQGLYNEVANTLLELRQQLSERELDTIRQLATLRYAKALVPAAFAGVIRSDETGQYRLQRLPARDDPMLARAERIRAQENLFIDIADEQYAELYTEMTPVYDLWRRLQRDQLAYRSAWEARLATRSAPPRNSYQALKRSYYNYRWAKIQRQEMKLLALGFKQEIAPTHMEVAGNVFTLSGKLEARHRQWRDILRQIYALETTGSGQVSAP